jgi:Asp/Glu/hydantoin racemase
MQILIINPNSSLEATEAMKASRRCALRARRNCVSRGLRTARFHD